MYKYKFIRKYKKNDNNIKLLWKTLIVLFV